MNTSLKLLCLFVTSSLAQEAIFLNDETFEHDTQASTGATTGDWIVLFCDKTKYAECR